MQRVQDMSVECIKLGIQADERYHLHEFVTEGIYMVVVAGLKAAVAFKETPRHKENQQITIQPDANRNISSPLMHPKEQDDVKSKSTSWVWTPW